jgi:hypothetical protein
MGNGDKGPGRRFQTDGRGLRPGQFVVQLSKIPFILVAGLDLADGFQAFLNAIGAGQFGADALAPESILQPPGTCHNQDRNRRRPQKGERHPPVHAPKADADELLQ